MLFAHLKRIPRLDRLRLGGPFGARDEFFPGGDPSENWQGWSCACFEVRRPSLPVTVKPWQCIRLRLHRHTGLGSRLASPIGVKAIDVSRHWINAMALSLLAAVSRDLKFTPVSEL